MGEQAGVGDDRTGFNAAAWLVDRQVAAGRGDAVAFRCGDEELTYAGLAAAVDRAANGLRSVGVAAGDRVLLVVNDELAFPAVYLAGLRLGAVPVPVSTMLRATDLGAIAADCGCAVAVVSERYAPHLEAMADLAPELRVACVVGAVPARPPAGLDVVGWSTWDDPTPTAVAPTDEATPGFWLYTSGTTGKPKGAIHRHGDIRAVVETYATQVLGIAAGDVCYSVPKLFFAFGLGNALLFPLAAGATAVLDPEPATPGRAAALLARHRPTLWFAPPGLCAALVDQGIDPDAFASVRAVVTAGEAFPAEAMRRFTARFATEVLDGIGSTEALHIFCSNRPGDVTPGTSGLPVPGYELRLLDEHGGEITEPDRPGALWIRGPSIATGYWQRPEVTADTFVDGWLRTGDVYSLTTGGRWRFVGRNSDMIKAGGIWVSPAEVENVLLAHAAVQEAAVVAGRDAAGLETTVAFVVARRGERIDVADLEAHCRREMAAFKRPRVVHVVDELPKTATGKIQRFALRDGLAPVAAPAAHRRVSGTSAARIPLARGEVEYLWVEGSRDLAPLVLLHEGLGSLGLWRDFPADLAALTGRRALVWSRHGYGWSAPARRPRPVGYMHDEALDVLPELLDRLGVDAPVLVGHSDGASIALLHAGATSRPVTAVVAMAPHVVVEDLTIAGIEAAREAWTTTDLPARLGRHHADADATFHGWNDIWLDPAFRSWSIEEHLPAVSAPVLALQCVDDGYGTADQLDRIARGVGGPVTTRLVAGAGHSPHLVAPSEVTAAVAAWLRPLP